MKNSKSQTLVDTIIRLKFNFWAWISPLFHLKSKFLAFWHYYKVEIRFLSLDLNHFFIWNQNFWLSGTITRLKFDFWAWIWTISSSEIKIFGFLTLLQGWNSIFEPGFHQFFIWNQKNLAFWHYYKVGIWFLSLDFSYFSNIS